MAQAFPMIRSLDFAWLRVCCLLALGGLSAGCQGTTEKAPKTLAVEFCSCGDPETDALGCPAACCAMSDAQCANVLCTCTPEPAGS